MPNVTKIVGGIFLIVIGVTIIHLSSLYHLIDIFTIIAIIIVVFGLYLLLVSFFERQLSSSKINDLVNGQNKNKSKFGNLEHKNSSKTFSNPRNKKPTPPTTFGNQGNNRFGGNNAPIDTRKITNKVKDMSRPKNPNEVLKPRSLKSNIISKNLNFTPNYERPVKVTRKPQRRNNGFDNGFEQRPDKVSKFPTVDRSEEIARALAEDDFIRPIHTERNNEIYNPEYNQVPNQNNRGNNQIPSPNRRVSNQAPKESIGINNQIPSQNRGINQVPNQNSGINNQIPSQNSRINQVPNQNRELPNNQYAGQSREANQNNHNQNNQYNNPNQENRNSNQQENNYNNLNQHNDNNSNLNHFNDNNSNLNQHNNNNNNNNHSNLNNQNDFNAQISEYILDKANSKDIYERISEYSSDSKLNNLDQNQNTIQDEMISSDLSKFSESYIISSRDAMTSQEAFDNIANNAKKEICIEISSIKDIPTKFLSKLSSLNVKMIIEEFDVKDMAYVLLISSLLEQGIKIKTMESINNMNLIADDSNALIMTEKYFNEDYNIGAIFSDSKSISNIKVIFESVWEMASDIKIPNNT
ncbi:MAG: hypothetical protein FWE58_01315 [Methanobrevibacter sp.]|nr:hypothetical protein [Methanobrevibacter sp.]